MSEDRLNTSAEVRFANELEALPRDDGRVRPPNWSMSPQAVVTYLLGGEAADGTPISAKYIGNRRLIETAVATLATDRALLLLGVPGTAKSWVSEHMAAAVSGDSGRIIQCAAGTDENQIRYGWNYVLLLSHGPSRDALANAANAGHGVGWHRAARRTDAYGLGRSGHTNHRVVGEDTADSGA
jgi:MoxR-like ATPase